MFITLDNNELQEIDGGGVFTGLAIAGLIVCGIFFAIGCVNGFCGG